MSKKFSILLVILVIGLFPAIGIGEDNSAQKEGTVFTNQDLDKYKKSSDSTTRVEKTDKKERREKAKEIKGEQEKEYWCKKATNYKRRIEKIQDDIEEVEKKISELQNTEPLTSTKKKKSTEKKVKKLQKDLEPERKQLRYAERDLSDFEDEAHRKGVPPGWLRCQFE